jgi:NAD(P)H-dependent flavin oxidoreductase YrpB (nitropropane dioxygenase family)
MMQRRARRPPGSFKEVAGFETSFTRLVGCRAPIQLAVMGGGTGTPGLAAAVSEAGGLGMLSSTFPLPVDEQLVWIQARTMGPVGVGFFAFEVPTMTEELEVAARTARVVDVFWGDPDPAVVNRIHAGGALAFWQVGSVGEASAAADAGCDAVVAQGMEAGGHVRGTTPMLTLLRHVVPAVDVPVVAAGGIATGAALAAALNAGAAAARVGTRFLASAESGAHPEYVAALLAASAGDSVRTTAFGEGWPDAPHRVLRTATQRAAGADDVVAQAEYRGRRWEVLRWSTQPPTLFTSGDVAAMAMYAGCGVGDIDDVPSAAQIVDQMMADALPLLSPPASSGLGGRSPW